MTQGVGIAVTVIFIVLIIILSYIIWRQPQNPNIDTFKVFIHFS